jgi:hypothetical protein
MEDTSQDDLAFYANLVKHRKNVKFYSPNDMFQKDVYIIQWENIMQSFDTGIICLMGAIQREDEGSLIQKLNIEIMSAMNFYTIWDRTSGSIFDYIKEQHAKKNIILSDDYMHDLEYEICAHIMQEKTGILFTISTPLSFWNAIISVYNNNYAEQLIFVIDEKDAYSCQHIPYDLLLQFFPEYIHCEIYIEYRKESFYDYITQYMNTNKSPLHIVCGEFKLLTDSMENTAIKNMTYIVPESTWLGIDHEIINALSITCKRNEYICYKQKPCLIN